MATQAERLKAIAGMPEMRAVRGGKKARLRRWLGLGLETHISLPSGPRSTMSSTSNAARRKRPRTTRARN
jgi:hypothetical protein